MTNGTMFCYMYGILLKRGTAHAWDIVNKLSREDEHVKRWFESQYTMSASIDKELIKVLDTNGL